MEFGKVEKTGVGLSAFAVADRLKWEYVDERDLASSRMANVERKREIEKHKTNGEREEFIQESER